MTRPGEAYRPSATGYDTVANALRAIQAVEKLTIS